MTNRRSLDADPSRDSRASDPEWIEAIRSELASGERTPAERAAFRARLDERIESRGRFVWQPWAMTTVAAVAAALLWFAMPGNLGESSNQPDESPWR